MKAELERVYDSADLKVTEIRLNGTASLGMEMRVPQTDKWVVSVKCGKGMLGCRIFDVECANQLNLALAVFSAPDLEEMLKMKPVKLSGRALELGADCGKTGEEIISLFSGLRA